MTTTNQGLADAPRVTIELTAEAAVEVQKFFETEGLDAASAALRVSVLPGGCSGFEYGLEVEESPAEEDDFRVESQGIRLLIDPFSAQYLAGVRIGYQSSFK
ncbi:MAG: iron-sulfur cluster assembly accessory protein [Gemmatimonadota bacterium]